MSGRYAATARGKPTFLDLDKAHPGQVFTALIWGENRAKFGAPEETYQKTGIALRGGYCLIAANRKSSPLIRLSYPPDSR